MSQAGEQADQKDLVEEASIVDQTSSGPAVMPSAPLRSSGQTRPPERAPSGGSAESEVQLPLPFESDADAGRGAVPGEKPPAKKKRRRPGGRGFPRVTRDPEVAKSYSDNVALDYAIARGLAQVLADLPPEELAALRSKIARSSRQNSTAPPARKTT